VWAAAGPGALGGCAPLLRLDLPRGSARPRRSGACLKPCTCTSYGAPARVKAAGATLGAEGGGVGDRAALGEAEGKAPRGERVAAAVGVDDLAGRRDRAPTPRRGAVPAAAAGALRLHHQAGARRPVPPTRARRGRGPLNTSLASIAPNGQAVVTGSFAAVRWAPVAAPALLRVYVEDVTRIVDESQMDPSRRSILETHDRSWLMWRASLRYWSRRRTSCTTGSRAKRSDQPDDKDAADAFRMMQVSSPAVSAPLSSPWPSTPSRACRCRPRLPTSMNYSGALGGPASTWLPERFRSGSQKIRRASRGNLRPRAPATARTGGADPAITSKAASARGLSPEIRGRACEHC
jgi:hypothetical protein